MSVNKEVIDLVLLAKSLIDPIRFGTSPTPHRISIAKQILTCHDAAELTFSAVSRQLGAHPKNNYLMEYIAAIKDAQSNQDVLGKAYFSTLNRVRNDIKHFGIFPETKQWFRVAENTYAYMNKICQEYLSIDIESLSEVDLIENANVRTFVRDAASAIDHEEWRSVLESLAKAMVSLFESNQALRGLAVGTPASEDAIKLASYGVHANDYLALQEFLPQAWKSDDTITCEWNVEKFGHPGNWRREPAEFCFSTFLHLAICIQHAEWIPGAIEFDAVYEHIIEAIEDDVQITSEHRDNWYTKPRIVVAHVMKKGEKLYGRATKPPTRALYDTVLGEVPEHKLSIICPTKELYGKVDPERVKVTCVPRNIDWVKEYFPNLVAFDYLKT